MTARARIRARTRARSSLLDFTRYTHPLYQASELHRQVAAKLDDVIEGRTTRLLLSMPPRHGKSELASRNLPAYYLGRHPDHEIICACYGDDLASEFGRDVRAVINSPQYRALFPETYLAKDSQAKDRWHTNKGGGYLSAGIGAGQGTSVTGYGAHLLVIDDPVKSRANAESEAYRKAIKDWYRAVAYTRLQPASAIIVIATRWQEDDLTGWLEQQELVGADHWDKLILPAINESGAALWPERFDVDTLKRIRKVVGEYDWASLYEQRPRPVEGSYFTLSDMLVDGVVEGHLIKVPVDFPERCDGVFAVVDSAVKTGKNNDGTAVTYFAFSEHGGHPLTILDWDIQQLDGALLETWLPTVFDYLETLAKECNATFGANAGVWIEDKSSGMILLQQAQKKSLNVKPIDTKLTEVGKSERAINASPYVNQGKVKFSKRAYDRIKTYKEVTRNHLLTQVLSFRIGTKDMSDDDLLDTFTYGVSLALGNVEGF